MSLGSNNLLFEEHRLYSRINENCTDLDLGEICSQNCLEKLQSCQLACSPGDSSCDSKCIREAFDCVDGCPCHTDCFDGCVDCPADVCNACADPGGNQDYIKCYEKLQEIRSDCMNSCSGNSTCLENCTSDFLEDIKNCPCEENCPNGCPCPSYDCDDSLAVLVLDREYSTRVPMLLGFDFLSEVQLKN